MQLEKVEYLMFLIWDRLITGPNSANYLDYVTTNNISNINNFQAQYSAICNHKGNFIDDIIVFKFKTDRFILIVNASNVDKVLNF